MRYLKVLVLVLFFCAAMIFFIQNTATLSVPIILRFAILHWQWISVPIPTYLMILGAFTLGALITTFFFLLEKLRTGRQLRLCKANLIQLQNERKSPEVSGTNRLNENL